MHYNWLSGYKRINTGFKPVALSVTNQLQIGVYMKNTRNIVIQENTLERVVICIDDTIQAVITFNICLFDEVKGQQITHVECEIKPLEEE